ncbi:uncharacterized protein H6S33_011008 [Morchella sextelata]|uniref:uncharacterized protein n=1 Tax=Morchella sextelata TaxID=1174677 RepID=UPI001D038CE7|nr:uncharacterized protein H6S33_011008 [Morchella sextelata]KAH0611743.1 hypothetical protein H6S33_011008 [Morchella sextelata]
MANTSSNDSEPTFDNHMGRIERLKSQMEDLRSTRKNYEADYAMWDRMVNPEGFRETIKGIIKRNIILDEAEWDKCIRKKARLTEMIKEIDERLVLLQGKMDPLLLGLMERRPTAGGGGGDLIE